MRVRGRPPLTLVILFTLLLTLSSLSMWPLLNDTLFPPLSEAWLQNASWDPEAQGWGAWNGAKKYSQALEGGDKEEDVRDAECLLLPLLEREDATECPTPAEELEAIKRKLWAMEQAQGSTEQPGVQGQIKDKEGTGCLETTLQKVEADHRSIYVGNVDYGGSAEELESYFNHCGNIHRVTILCDKFSGHPKGYAYIEFANESSVQAAMELDSTVFRGRIIKVLPKRTNFPGISSTDRGGPRGHLGTRGGPCSRSGLHAGAHFRLQGRNWGRGRHSPWFSSY